MSTDTHLIVDVGRFLIKSVIKPILILRIVIAGLYLKRCQIGDRSVDIGFITHGRINFLGYWGYAEDLMVMSLWPIFIYITVSDFFQVGVISTIAAVIGTVVMLYIGKLTDRQNKGRLIELSSIFYGLTWCLRFLVGGTIGSVLAFDALTKGSKDTLNVPMISLTFEHAAKRGPDYAIAYSVFYEFSLSIGKIVTALLAIVLLSAGASIFWVFAMAGVLTMFYSLLK